MKKIGTPQHSRNNLLCLFLLNNNLQYNRRYKKACNTGRVSFGKRKIF